MAYYDRDYLEACLQVGYDSALELARAAIDHGIDDVDTLYTDLDIAAPVFQFRFRDEQYEYNAIIRDWNSRLRSAIDNYLDSHNRERVRAAQRAREKKEEERRREEAERRREEEQERREEEKAQQRAEKRKEQDKKNREKLDRIQEEWKAKHSAQPATQPQLPADSIHCSSCGTDNAKSAKFCTHCGTQLQISCPSCGELIRVGSKFCCKCGKKI